MPLESLKKIYGSLPIIRELRMISANLDRINQGLTLATSIEAARLDFELKSNPRYSAPKRLNLFEKKVNSQNGEDGIIQEIFRRIGTTDRFFVEVGVADGVECNTAFLLSQGWKGAWIDGRGLFRNVVDARADLRGRLNGVQAFVTRENISSLLKQAQAPPEFDLLSLDIDLNTYYAWEGVKEFRPRVVVIEYNSVVPPDREWKPEYKTDRVWDGTNNYGASLKSMELLGRERGYSLVGCEICGVNAFFVRNDLVGEKFEAPFTAENHYEPPRFALSQLRRAHLPTILDTHGG
jgi:hypothetical protein